MIYVLLIMSNYIIIMSPPIKWGDILYLALLSVLPSVRLSTCLFGTLSCPLYIF